MAVLDHGTIGGDARFAKSQLIAIQLAYIFAIVAIALAELMQPRISAKVLSLWIGDSALNLVLRLYLHKKVLTPNRLIDFTGSPWLRMVPLLCNIIVGIHWAWTAYLFVGMN